jgi:hypothetical protein
MAQKAIFVIGLVLIVFFALDKFELSRAQEKVSEGKLGDVKYSVLDPTRFIEVNGGGWVLMDGRSIEGSDLFAVSGLKTAYDAQGVFIRGLNLNRDPNIGDPEGQDRLLGSYQRDMVIDHSHKYTSLGNTLWADKGYSEQGRPIRLAATSETDTPTNSNPAAQRISGVETRPRNIALYTYIKINN